MTTSGANAPKVVGTFKTQVLGFDREKPLVETSLESVGFPELTIVLPEGAEIERPVPGGWIYISEQTVNYRITLEEGEFDPDVKQRWRTLDPKGKVIIDEPDVVLYERHSGSYWLVTKKRVGEEVYTCELQLGISFDLTLAGAQQIIASCLTLKAR